MKKFFIIVIACLLSVITLSLAACDNDKGGTYYPDNAEMQTNLENAGFTVTLSTDLDGRSGTCLSAVKGNDYIEFYRLDNSADCEYFYNISERNHAEYNSLVKTENDEKFGNIVYCGTEPAITAAGIKVVKVKV